ncbi:FHA domain-containing protein [Thalassoglobus sp. JC818]|uniref:FHA domain-containing protein n=1 Tax=Thalassoglobus sp. JC818 TaxID=3232136 RepID=UPI003458F122
MNNPNPQGREFRLRIERGNTKFPNRPIHSDRFLIGAGTNCHLQLGGEMPILHSVIVTNGDALWIDAVVAEPPLLINRNPTREGPLSAGDLIEIGPFVFHVESKPIAEAASSDDADDEPVDLSELSADELVDLMQSEIDSLAAVEQSRRTGASALLRALARIEDSAPSAHMQETEEELASRSDRENELRRIEEELDARSARLQAAQDRLAEMLQALASRQPSDDGEDDSMRLTA